MKDRLPVCLENRDLPVDEFDIVKEDRSNSYGYVSILNLASIIITIASVLTIIYLGNR